MSSGLFPPQFRNPKHAGSPKNSDLLPCGIDRRRHAFDCMSGFPD